MPFTNPILGSGGTLIREAIHSPNYVPGVSGWSINRDGTAEFNNVTVRGEVIVGTYPAGPYARLTAAPADGPGLYVGTGASAETAPGLLGSADLVVGLATLLASPAGDGTGPATLDVVEWAASNGGLPEVYAQQVALARPYGGWWDSAGAQAIPTTSTTLLTDFRALRVNNGPVGGISKSIIVNAGIFTPQVAGVWEFMLQGRFGANATGARIVYARDLAAVDQEVGVDPTPLVTQPCTFTVWWTDVFNGSTDAFRWRVFQNSGGNLNWRTQRASARFVSL